MDAAPLADACAPLLAPRSDTCLSAHPSCAAGFWEMGVQRADGFTTAGKFQSACEGVFFFLVLEVTFKKKKKESIFAKETSPREVQRFGLIAPCVDCICPQPGTQQLSGEEWDYSKVK